MRTLLRGGESRERIKLILSLTSIRSDDIQSMIYKIYVDGWRDEAAAEMFNIPQPNINRAIARLNKAAAIVEEIKELDWSRFRESVK